MSTSTFERGIASDPSLTDGDLLALWASHTPATYDTLAGCPTCGSDRNLCATARIAYSRLRDTLNGQTGDRLRRMALMHLSYRQFTDLIASTPAAGLLVGAR